MANETEKKRNIKKTEPKTTQTKKRTYRVKANIDPRTVVTVVNGFAGRLIYESKKTGELFTWEEFGDEQDMELAELKVARNSSKAFFENNWFLIDDPEIIDYLNAQKYYENSVGYDNFDELFEESPKDIAEKVSKMSKGQKGSVKYRAKQLIADGKIDSLKVIEALEKSLGVQLIER